jgi:hypothetical protein
MATLKDIDVTKLSHAQKLFLYDYLQEKKRRLREKRAVYNPNEGQKKVHESKAAIRVVTAGNGSGKTALGANEAMWAAEGWNPIRQIFTKVPAKVVVVLDKPEKVGDLWIPELQKWFNFKDDQFFKNGKPYINEIRLDNGSHIVFMFHLQEEMAFESIQVDVVIFDEPPPRHVWIGLRRAGRKKGRPPRYLFIGTPISQAWIRKDLIEPALDGTLKGVECFKYGTAVNKSNLAENYEEEYGKHLTEKERRIRFHGDFFDLDGLALAHLFNRETHIIKGVFDQANPVVVAIDPHTSKPHHAVMLGVDRDNYLYLIKELKLKATAREFAKKLKDWYKGYRVIDIVGDSAGNAEMTSGEGFMSFFQVLREEEVFIRATTYDEKDDEDFIERIRGALETPKEPNNVGEYWPKLRIYEGNPGIVSDIENVQFVKIKNLDEFKPKLDIQNKDYLSCLKYALATNLFFKKQNTAVYKPIKPPTSYGIRKRNTGRIGLKPR